MNYYFKIYIIFLYIVNTSTPFLGSHILTAYAKSLLELTIRH